MSIPDWSNVKIPFVISCILDMLPGINISGKDSSFEINIVRSRSVVRNNTV